ncbi:FecR domain-containing protein [Verrucomicrobiaceae bacterium N1E253]|uniref:FecR domain-containing protein n=1 Tax=Oceaniferula marina TaxID=2748318 RepID=A0A851GKC6_9BACT|nr:LamG-like jellyroll fold domain-containing protein [Oceaniferula marina]NWK57599.1 FecR domain-containing protein [Oceaniferula marina]
MSNQQQPRLISLDQVEKIIQDLEDGVISDRDLMWLKENIKSNPDVRSLYFQHMELVALLKRDVQIRDDLGSIPVSAVRLGMERRKMAVTSLVVGLAAILLLSFGFFLFHVSNRQVQEPTWVLMEQSGDALCTVTTSDGEMRPNGQLLPGDSIQIEQGLVKFLFPSGVEALIEGPSDLKLIAKTELSMQRGAAWFRVPEAGHGFTVTTDRAQIIDLGTEFGLRFDGDEKLQVHVNQGKVRVEPALQAMEQIELKQNQAMAFNIYGQGESIKAEPSLFRRTFTDSMPYLHWSFDHQNQGRFAADGTIPGAAGFGASLQRLHSRTKRIDAPKYETAGRFGSALALHGDGVYAASAFAGIGENAPRSVAAWIRHRKNCERHNITPYCAWGVRKKGKLWQISFSDEGRLKTSLMERPFETIQAQDTMQQEWVHIAVVYTGRVDDDGFPEIYHYLNGKRQAVSKPDELCKMKTDNFTKSALPVRFGASLGPGADSRTLDADMDELYLFRGILSEKQIQQLMKTNHLDFFLD